jgi:hypothetical protein
VSVVHHELARFISDLRRERWVASTLEDHFERSALGGDDDMITPYVLATAATDLRGTRAKERVRKAIAKEVEAHAFG